MSALTLTSTMPYWMSALTLTSTMPYWMPALMAFAVFRRVRRQFGVQPWRPVRAWVRVVFLGLVACMLLALTALRPEMALPVGIGTALGIGLGLLGLRHTHVAWLDGARTYTPNPWIGGLLSALLVGRIAWRATHGGFAAAQQSPSGLTFGIAMVLIAYSLVYVIGLMLQMKRLGEAPPTASTPL